MTAGWTDDRVGALKKLWLEGQSASQIAKQLGGGVTRNAVIGKVHRLGLSGRAAPSQPARTVAATFRTTRPRPAAAAPAPAPTQPSAPRRLEAVQPKPVQPAAPVPAPMPDLPGTATVMTLGRTCANGQSATRRRASSASAAVAPRKASIASNTPASPTSPRSSAARTARPTWPAACVATSKCAIARRAAARCLSAAFRAVMPASQRLSREPTSPSPARASGRRDFRGGAAVHPG